MVVIVGFGIGGVQVTMDLVGAGILDEDSRKHGVQREGTFSSMQGILNKSSGLFVSLGYFLVFKLFGFESGTNTGANPGLAARFLMILFPCVLFVICIVTAQFLKFDNAVMEKDNQ